MEDQIIRQTLLVGISWVQGGSSGNTFRLISSAGGGAGAAGAIRIGGAGSSTFVGDTSVTG